MRVLLIIACFVLNSAIALENGCLPGWTLFKGDGSCLRFYFPIIQNYPGALSFCQGLQGHLVQIQDSEKNYAVYDLLRNAPNKKTWIATWKPNNETYGLFYSHSKKKFVPPTEREGTQGGTRCRQMKEYHNNIQWDTIDCGWSGSPFVCEMPGVKVAKVCPDGWTQFKGDESCIKVENGRKLSWHDAQSICQQEKGDLFLPIEGEKANFVIGLQKVNTHYWVGFADKDEDGQFNLINGGNMTKTLPWRKREPNNAHGNEHCGEMKDGLLYDKRCGRKRNFVCEL